jgi:hypothetical protein
MFIVISKNVVEVFLDAGLGLLDYISFEEVRVRGCEGSSYYNVLRVILIKILIFIEFGLNSDPSWTGKAGGW